MARALRHYPGGEGAEILAAFEGRRRIAAGEAREMDDVFAEFEAITDGKAA